MLSPKSNSSQNCAKGAVAHAKTAGAD